MKVLVVRPHSYLGRDTSVVLDVVCLSRFRVLFYGLLLYFIVALPFILFIALLYVFVHLPLVSHLGSPEGVERWGRVY